MTAYAEMIQYLEDLDVEKANEHADALMHIALRVLSDQRTSPQKFVAIPKAQFLGMYSFQESAILSFFQDIDIDQVSEAAKMLSAGIVVQTPDYIIIPWPSFSIIKHELEQ